MDVVRRRIQALLNRDSVTLAEVSRSIGRNHAYLQQFMRRGTPRNLPEDVRMTLARYFSVDESDLRPPRNIELDDRAGDDEHNSRRVPKSFAARLSIARAESVYETPSSFAEAVGIDRLRYADLEEGEESPTLEELDQISRCSGKPLDWLIRGEMPQFPARSDLASPLERNGGVNVNSSISMQQRKKRGSSSH